MSNTLKNRLIEIFKSTDVVFKDEEELADLVLAEVKKETKQAIEKVRLEKMFVRKMPIGGSLEEEFDADDWNEKAFYYNQAVADLEKKKKQVIKGL